MEPLRFSRFTFHGLLKSSHALLGLLIIFMAILFALCLHAQFEFGEYLFSLIITTLSISIIYRYTYHGPESDRSQPTVSVTQHDNRVQTQIVNVAGTNEIISIINAVNNRRTLPAPTGIVEGSVSDPTALKSISADIAEKLQKEDVARLTPSN